MAMLIKDKKGDPQGRSGVDSIQEDWANPEKIYEVISELAFEQGSISVKIEDEMGKIQINALVKDFPAGQTFNEAQKPLWDRILRNLMANDESFSDIEPTSIINALKDWLDSKDDDAITDLSGAEADYYRSLDPPYLPANGPMRHVDELRLVKGMRPEFFAEKGQVGSLEDYMTVYGLPSMTQTGREMSKNYSFSGKININTASLPVLMALLPSENPEYAQAIYNYRNEKDEDGNFINTNLSTPNWYKSVPDIPEDLNIDNALLTTSSDYFRIRATARLHDAELTLNVAVHRETEKISGKWICRVLSWAQESLPPVTPETIESAGENK
jgi:general secretion pathway protein K